MGNGKFKNLHDNRESYRKYKHKQLTMRIMCEECKNNKIYPILTKRSYNYGGSLVCALRYSYEEKKLAHNRNTISNSSMRVY